METSKDGFDLPPFESMISRKILEKLGKQISLAKAAATKVDSSANDSLPLPSITSKEILSEEKYAIEGGDTISLEATLEYKRLRSEFSKMKLKPREVDQDQKVSPELISLSTSQDNFSEDIDFMLNIIRKTNRSLKEENNFSVFKEDVVKASLHLNAENQLKADITHTKERIGQIKQEIRKRELEISLEEQEKVGEIGRLKDEHYLIRSEGTSTLKFTDSFFDAQSCNSSCSHQSKVETETKNIAQINQKIDRDVHCLAVMESWTEEFCEQLEAKIGEWKRKLRGDELVMDMRIDAKRRAIKSQQELIKSLNETIAERLEELAPWEAEKEVERQERLAHMRRYYSVRKIQRWWRGYMVKLKLYKRRKVKPKA